MKKVTCFYCEYFECLYTLNFTDYVLSEFGICAHKEKCRKANLTTCEEFKLRTGLHTVRWYPGKKD